MKFDPTTIHVYESLVKKNGDFLLCEHDHIPYALSLFPIPATSDWGSNSHLDLFIAERVLALWDTAFVDKKPYSYCVGRTGEEILRCPRAHAGEQRKTVVVRCGSQMAIGYCDIHDIIHWPIVETDLFFLDALERLMTAFPESVYPTDDGSLYRDAMK